MGSSLEEDEILTGIEIPKVGENFSGSYLRFCPGERPSATVYDATGVRIREVPLRGERVWKALTEGKGDEGSGRG